MTRHLLLGLLLSLTAHAANPDEKASCIVARIVDGDTFECRGGTMIRLLLLDAPEKRQVPMGVKALEKLGDLLPIGSKVELEFDVRAVDRYGRSLAYAYTDDGILVNEEMARLGMGVLETYPPNVRYVELIEDAVKEARSKRRGLWSRKAFSSCLPKDFRKGLCE
jgi:micrococcal nuclease